MELNNVIEKYLQTQKLMQLSTLSADTGTRTCSVWYAVDDQLDLYFFSSTLREHSKDILLDGRVSGAIAKPQDPDDAPQGVQFAGTAKPLEDLDEIDAARWLYKDRIFADDKIQEQIDTNNHRFYKVSIDWYKLLDPANFPDEPYQMLSLEQDKITKGNPMTIQALFIKANTELEKVVAAITDEQWQMDASEASGGRSDTLAAMIRDHTYDDAWIPEILAGTKFVADNDQFAYLKDPVEDKEVAPTCSKYNRLARDIVQDFEDLESTTYLSYGEWTARDYLQHVTSYRVFRVFDIATLIGYDLELDEDYLKGLFAEFEPVVDTYRKMGVLSDPARVSYDAGLQERFMGMIGREMVTDSKNS